MIELEDLGTELRRRHGAAIPDVAVIVAAGARRRARRHRIGSGVVAVIAVSVLGGAALTVATAGDDSSTSIRSAAGGSGATRPESTARWESLPDLPGGLEAPVGAMVVDGRIVAVGMADDPRVVRIFELAVDGRSWTEPEAPDLTALALANGDGSDSSVITAVGTRPVLLGRGEQGLQVVLSEADGSWRTLPAPPTSADAASTFLAVGDDLVLWGGEDDERHAVGDGIVLRPGQPAWTALPPSPLGARAGVEAVAWKGRAVLLGGGDAAQGYTDGAILDVSTRSWSAVEPLPRAVSVTALVLVDDDVVGVGADADGRAVAAVLTAEGSWIPVGEPGPEIRRSAVTSTSGEVVVWSGADSTRGSPPLTTASVLSLESGKWRSTAASPPGSGRCLSTGVSVGSDVVWLGGLRSCDDPTAPSSPSVLRLRGI